MENWAEKKAEDFLEKKGFEVVKREIISNEQDLHKLQLAFPWAMKVSSEKIIHKKAAGGVLLNIQNFIEAEEAFNKLFKLSKEILIQPMVEGKELILGIKKTNEFGQVIMLGKGGSEVEKEKDIVFRLPPLSAKEAEEMIKNIKFYDSIKELNLKKLKEDLIRLSNLAEKNPNIEELDINPLKINDKKTVVIDARIKFD